MPGASLKNDFAAAVIAGGRSQRMGRDKAQLRWPDGPSLLERQLDVLRQLQPAELWISARADQALPQLAADVARANDAGDAGPLGGIVELLRATRQPRVLVLAVDMPLIDSATLQLLLRCPKPGAVFDVQGRLEPLAALYPVTWKPLAEAALAGNEHSLQRLLRTADAARCFTIMPADDPSRFANWNTPADVPANVFTPSSRPSGSQAPKPHVDDLGSSS